MQTLFLFLIRCRFLVADTGEAVATLFHAMA